jgi:hypothetical protein
MDNKSQPLTNALVALPGLLVSVLVFLAGVGPHGAKSNLAEWAELIGVEAWPAWLTDRRAIFIGLTLAVLFYGWWLRRSIGEWVARVPVVWRRVKRYRLRSPFFVPAPSPEPASPMTVEEREEVQQLRTFWNLYFLPAAQACDAILAVVLHELEQRTYWCELARPKLYRQKNAMQALSEALDPASGMRLFEVQARQDEAWGAYLDARYWVAVIAEKEGIDIANNPTMYNLAGWRAADAKVREKIRELVQRPAQANLRIIPAPRPSDAAVRLLYPPERFA